MSEYIFCTDCDDANPVARNLDPALDMRCANCGGGRVINLVRSDLNIPVGAYDAVVAERDRLLVLLSDLVSATREFVYGEGYVVDLEECGLNAATDYLFEGDDDD